MIMSNEDLQKQVLFWKNLAIDLTKVCSVNRGDPCDHCAAWVTVADALRKERNNNN